MIEKLKENFYEKLKNAKKIDDIRKIKTEFLGKEGEITKLLKNLPSLGEKERREIGKKINEIKEEIEKAIAKREEEIEIEEEKEKAKEILSLDLSLPGRVIPMGRIHPITKTMMEIEEIFVSMGYEVEDGPEIETDWFNFTALNIPPHHPARDMQDTFYLEGGFLLRTHTSPVQIRAMLKRKKTEDGSPDIPIMIIAPGKVFRRDWDISHSPVFHQVEGLYVDKYVRFSDLLGTLEFFFKKFFGDVKVRFRASYFPFTEPSAEVDISCICNGKCSLCKGSGFLEVAGCGMVHPEVFKSVGFCGVSGFAFGMGVERLAMIKYGIPDIRLFFGGYEELI